MKPACSKFTVRLKSDAPKATFTDEMKQHDWRVAIQMLQYLLVRTAAVFQSTSNTSSECELPPAASSGQQKPLTEQFHYYFPTDAASSSSSDDLSRTLFSFEVVATSVRNLVRNGYAKELFEEGLVVTFRSFVGKSVERIAEQTRQEVISILKAVSQLWEGFTLALHHIAAVFAELGQGYVIQQTQERSIRAVGGKILCETLKQHQQVQLLSMCYQGFLELLASDRSGDSIDRSLLQHMRQIALESQTYFSHLEPAVVAATAAFYTREGDTLVHVECLEGDAFFERVYRRIQEERDRAACCFDVKSKAAVEETVQKALLEVHGPNMLQQSFAELVTSSNYAAIKLAWKLLSLRFVGKGDTARSCLRDYIVRQGTAIVMTPSADKSAPTSTAPAAGTAMEEAVVTGLIELYDKMEAVVKKSFESMGTFSLTLREAFEAAIRPREAKTAEFLAKYLDLSLREGAKKETDAEVEASVDAGMKLFNFIPAKDVFEAFYAELLARRILSQRVRSLDLERSVIRKIKDVVGSSTSAKLEGMMKDVTVNEELGKQHREFIEVQHSQEGPLQTATRAIEMKTTVLTVGYWPTFPKLDLVLPPLLKTLHDSFVSFYCSRHSGRKVSWLFTMSTCTVRCSFAGTLSAEGAAVTKASSQAAKKEVSMNALQGLILELFNAVPIGGSLTMGDICSMLTPPPSLVSPPVSTTTSGSPDGGAANQANVEIQLNEKCPELICALLSISGNPVQKLLVRGSGSSSGAIQMSEAFSINEAFTHRQVKFRVNQVQHKDTQAEAQQTKDRTIAERSYVIDAAIVRYMKSRRRASHADVMNDVIAMLKFPAGNADVKKRVEILIEREYIKRDPADASVYEYLA